MKHSIRRPAKKMESALDYIKYSLLPSSKWVKTKLMPVNHEVELAPQYAIARSWWAYTPKKFNVVTLIAKRSAPFLNKEYSWEGRSDSKYSIMDYDAKAHGEMANLVEVLGVRGVDWDFIEFGNKYLYALATTSDDWIVMAKIAGVNMEALQIMTNNYLEYRSKPKVAKEAKSAS